MSWTVLAMVGGRATGRDAARLALRTLRRTGVTRYRGYVAYLCRDHQGLGVRVVYNAAQAAQSKLHTPSKP